ARRWRLGLLASALSLAACGAPGEGPSADGDSHDHEELAERSDELVGYDCATKQDTGYTSGNAFAITVVTVDGKPVEIETANAFLTMAKAAEASGIQLRINSGFRTMAEQQYYYNCYINQNCNDGNLAAKPGYSNHQSGHALDLNTGGGALNWLNNNGAKFGFKRTVPSESWHWEWWGGGSPQAICSTTPPLAAEFVGQSASAKADPSGQAQFTLCTGEPVTLSFEVRNTGGTSWVDWGDSGTDWGRRVRLGSVGDKVDPLGLGGRQSLNGNANPDVHPASTADDCNDKALCERTVFSQGGMKGKAPDQPGIYKTEWQLVDDGRAWFGPIMWLTFNVQTCEDPGTGGAAGAGVLARLDVE
ncbi:MAG: hypothetical protein EOO74_11930, partial [Myxococcales bacterium]